VNWNHYPSYPHQRIASIYWRHEPVDFQALGASVLPHGNGRSYSDCCLNENNTLISTKKLNKFIQFDTQTGILTCEAGVLFSDILAITVPQGWFLPVLPGTQYVTVGGAIANDVHGKNHLSAGTFSLHVLELELLRSDGQRYMCSNQANTPLFQATIGGLGLTGLILSATIQLKPIQNAYLDVHQQPFYSVDQLFVLNQEMSTQYEYTIAWFDPYRERGFYMAAKHNTDAALHAKQEAQPRSFSLPCYGHPLLFNTFTIALFNQLYFQKSKNKPQQQVQHYRSFFFPLDAMLNWNKVYGRQGFLQYQCVLPTVTEAKTFLQTVKDSPCKTSLMVIKTFGERVSPGLLSFPQPGITIAMDFVNSGKPLFEFLDQLDAMVMRCHGRVNPSKDARMSSAAFSQFFPRQSVFTSYKDPHFSSSFWRRVTETS
jgi:hypothetical protein